MVLYVTYLIVSVVSYVGVILLRQLDFSVSNNNIQTVCDNQYLQHSEGTSFWRKIVDAAFPAGLFTLKFLEWWYSEENSGSVRTLTTLPVPPPPPIVQVITSVFKYTCLTILPYIMEAK